MKQLLIYISCIFFITILCNCQEKEIERYKDDPRLYFSREKWSENYSNQGDSTEHSFFTLPDDQLRDTVWVDIRTMGLPTDFPRPFRIVQTNAKQADAAIPGKHYVAFDDESIRDLMMIPAGKVQHFMPVIVLRDPSLDTCRVRIEMEVEANDYFKVGLTSLSRFMVSTTSEVQEPKLWESFWQYYYGDWGPRKMWFLIRYVGISDFEKYPNDDAMILYLPAAAYGALEKYNADENNPDRPLQEADGTLVEFPL